MLTNGSSRISQNLIGSLQQETKSKWTKASQCKDILSDSTQQSQGNKRDYQLLL